MDFLSNFLIQPINIFIITICVIGFQITLSNSIKKKTSYNYFTYEYMGKKSCGLKNHYMTILFEEMRNEEFFYSIKTISFQKFDNGDLKCLLNDHKDNQYTLSIWKINKNKE